MYKDSISLADKARRAAFRLTWNVLARPTPRPMHRWRCAILRVFGAEIGHRCSVYPSTRVWAPWNLVMEDDSCLAEDVDCYNVARIQLGKHAVVSQRSFLCSASHDLENENFSLESAPISLGERAWIAAESFVGPGITVASGAVAAARSVVVKDVPEWTTVGGNPARPIGQRRMRPGMSD